MLRVSALSTAVLLIVGLQPIAAWAETDFSPHLTAASSTYFGFGSNANLTRDNHLNGFNTTPSVQLRFDQALTKNVALVATTSAIVDRFSKTEASSDTFNASVGFAISVGDWSYLVNYRPLWIFQPAFRALDVRTDAFNIIGTSPKIAIRDDTSLQFQFGHRETLAIFGTSSSHSPFASATISSKLSGIASDWTASATVVARYTSYVNATNTRDYLLIPSVSLERSLSDTTSLSIGAEYTNRDSSISQRLAEGVTVGMNLKLTLDLF
jgi:hypothetical protein